MKKLLFLLTIFTFTSFITMNETSCFCVNKEKAANSAMDKINKAENINVKGLNVNSDASNLITTKLILDYIGLTSKEQKVTTISGNLTMDAATDLVFTVEGNSPISKSVSWFTNNFAFSTFASKQTIIVNNITWVGSITKGLWKSNDGGNTFIQDDSFPANAKVQTLYKNKKNYIYIGILSENTYVSKDNGQTWNPLSIALSAYSYCQLQDNSMLIGTEQGLFKGTIDNLTFTEVTAIPKQITYSITSSGSDVYLGCQNGLYISNDNGNTFTIVPATILRQSPTTALLIISTNTIYVGGSDGLYISTDKGQIFTLVNNLGDGTTDKIVSYIYYSSTTKLIYFGYGHKYFYCTKNGIDFTDISFGKNAAHISEINKCLWIVGDNNYDGSDTTGLYYYNLNY